MFLDRRKQALRRRMLGARDAARAANPDAGQSLADNFPDEIWPPLNSVAAGYWPIGSEIDPRPLMSMFACEQVRLCLPVMQAPDTPLVFRAWAPGDDMDLARFGVSEPRADRPVVSPQLVLVPLLAADRRGGRLGYGKGYYDRTLSALAECGSLVSVGLAFEAQLTDRVPMGRHDVRLDWVVTEKAAYKVDDPAGR